MTALPKKLVLVLLFVITGGLSYTMVNLLSAALSSTRRVVQVHDTPAQSITGTGIIHAAINLTALTVEDVSRCSYEQRKVNIRQACERNPDLMKRGYPQNSAAAHDHLMVDDIHKVIYCYVPKAGCSAWKHVIALKSGKAKLEDLQSDWNIVHEPGKAKQLGLHRLSENKIEDIHWKLKNYTKFVIARHPLSRLFSAYVDKFVWFYHRYAKVYYSQILAKFFPEVPLVDGNRFITFEQLVKLVVTAYKKPEKYLYLPTIDEHWRTINGMCHPCFIDYDYIAKIETMDDDLQPLLKLFNATELPSVHIMEEDEARRKNVFGYTKPPIEEAYANIPENLMAELIDVFGVDFDLFGYEHVPGKAPACKYKSVSHSCC